MPGPDFVLILRTAIAHSRRDAMMAALGITLGVAVWAVLALLGLQALFQTFPLAQIALMIIGGLYLLYLGGTIGRDAVANFKGNATPINLTPYQYTHFFRRGLFTNLANPKAVMYFASVFALLTAQSSGWLDGLLVFLIVTGETIAWFAMVSIFFSVAGFRARYLRFQKWLDMVTASVFCAYALFMLYEGMMLLQILW